LAQVVENGMKHRASASAAAPEDEPEDADEE
jgi:hypothetical protein